MKEKIIAFIENKLGRQLNPGELNELLQGTGLIDITEEMKSTCGDCGKDISPKHKFCSRCLAVWHIENEVPDDVPCADFDEPDRGDEY